DPRQKCDVRAVLRVVQARLTSRPRTECGRLDGNVESTQASHGYTGKAILPANEDIILLRDSEKHFVVVQISRGKIDSAGFETPPKHRRECLSQKPNWAE